MTVKISVNIEPVHETAKVSVLVEKQDERGNWNVVSRSDMATPVPTQSPTYSLDVGERFTVSLEPGDKIVYDAAQGVVSVEAPQSAPKVEPAASKRAAAKEHV